MSPRVAVILLNWKRPKQLIELVEKLEHQTYQDFDIYISNGSPDHHHNSVLKSRLASKDRIYLINDTNEYSCFRRFNLAKKIYQKYDIFFFLDDDVTISNTFIEQSIRQYVPKTYFSWYAWQFLEGGKDYYNSRTRIYNQEDKIHYGGPGVSMVDSTIFKDPRFFNVPNLQAYEIDDLWISYFCDNVIHWPIKYLDVKGIELGGGDKVALYQDIEKRGYNKNSFLQELKQLGWKL